MYEKLLYLVLAALSVTSGFSACDIVPTDKKLVDDRLYLRENLDSKDINSVDIFGIDSGKYAGLYDKFSIESSVTIGTSSGKITATDEVGGDIDTTFHATGPQIDQDITYDINYKKQNYSANVDFNYTKHSKTDFPITLVYKDPDLVHVVDKPLTLNYTKHNKYITIEYERVDSEQKTVNIPADKFIFDDNSIFTNIDKTLDITYKPQSKLKTINLEYKNKSTSLTQNKLNLTYKTYTKSNLNITFNYSDENTSEIDDIDIKALSGFSSDDFNFLNATGLPAGITMNNDGIISGSNNGKSLSAIISFTYQDNEIVDIDLKTSNLLDNNQAHNISMTNLQSTLTCSTDGIISGTTTGQGITYATTGDSQISYKDDEIVDIDLKTSAGVNDATAREFSISSLPSNLVLDDNSGVLSGRYINHPSTLSKTISYKNNEIVDIDLKTELSNIDAREFVISSDDLNGLTLFDANIGIISGTLSANTPVATSMDIVLSYKSNKIVDINLTTIIDSTHTDAREFTNLSLPSGLSVNSSGLISGTMTNRSDINDNIECNYYRNTIKDVNLSSELEEQYSTILNSRLFTEKYPTSSFWKFPNGLSIDTDKRTVKGIMDEFISSKYTYFTYYTNQVNLTGNLYSFIDGMSNTARGVQNTEFSEEGIGFIKVESTDYSKASEEYKSQKAGYLKIGGQIAPDNEFDLAKDITFSLDYYPSNNINDILLPAEIGDDKARYFIESSYQNLPNGLSKNKDGKISGSVNLRPQNSTVNIDFEYYNSTINPITDIRGSTYIKDSVARYFTKKSLPTGLDIDYTTGIISGDVATPYAYDTTLPSDINIEYYNNEIIPIQLASNNISNGVQGYNSTLFESYSGSLLDGLNIDSNTGDVTGTTGVMQGDGIISTGHTTTMSYTPKELTFDIRVKDHPKLNILNIQADKSYFDLTLSSFDLNRYFTDSSDENLSYVMEKSSASFGLPRGFTQGDQCDGNITGSLNDNIDNNLMNVKAQDILGQEVEHNFILRYLLD